MNPVDDGPPPRGWVMGFRLFTRRAHLELSIIHQIDEGDVRSPVIACARSIVDSFLRVRLRRTQGG